MTATLSRPDASPSGAELALTGGRLSRAQLLGLAAGGIVVGALSWVPSGSPNWARWIVVAVLAYVLGLYVAARRVEGRRKALDRLVTSTVTACFGLVALPLVSVVWTVVQRGWGRMDATFFTDTMRGVVGDGGGVLHAIVGTLIITGLATLMAVPIGVFTAIYLVEYGRATSRLSRSITTMVDVMTGIPSIVAGLFAYALFVRFFGPGTRTGLAGAVALAVLMIPIVVRASVEMLRLVPDELRHGSYALGVPKWQTIVRVVLPTASAGILTGVTLAIARVVGETAPLLITAGLAQDLNNNPFDGRMTTLPVYSYYAYTQPGTPREPGLERAWAAALVLILVVAVLFTVARLLARWLRPEGMR